MYLTIEDIKRHLNIDYEEDDRYLKDLIEAAEKSVEKFIQQPLEGLVEDGSIPADLKHGVRLMVGNLYANRESVSFGEPREIPYSLTWLLMPYRKLN